MSIGLFFSLFPGKDKDHYQLKKDQKANDKKF